MRRIILFNRYEDESLNDYIVRLGLQRQDLNLTWIDITNEVNEQFNVSLSDNAVRKRYQKNLNKYNPESFVEQKIIDKTELFKLQNERTQLNNYYKSLSREDTLRELGLDAAKIVAQQKPFLDRPEVPVEIATSDTSGILLIGDWHYGITIESNFNRYNTDIAKERINLLLKKTIQLIQKNSIKHLYVINLGDMIAGNIHLPLRLSSQIDV